MHTGLLLKVFIYLFYLVGLFTYLFIYFIWVGIDFLFWFCAL